MTGPPLRVVHLCTVSDSLNLLLKGEIEAVRAAGVEVIGVSGRGSPGQRDPDELVASLTRRMDLCADARMTVELYRTLRRLQPDVVHTHTPKAGLFGRVLGRMARVPIVVNTCHGLIVPPGAASWKRGVLALIEGTAALFSDAELFQSAADRQRLRRVMRSGRVHVVGNGTDLNRFRYDPSEREVARIAHGFGKDELVVLGVGRRVRDKGIVEFCAAAATLARPGVRFVWAGGGQPDKNDGFDEETPEVTMLGHVDDMRALYHAADVFVLPSYREGFPRSAMEAAATGLPLILSDIPGCRQLGDESAMFVAARDTDVLVGGIRQVIDDEGLRLLLSRRAQRRARTHFDQRRIAASSLDAYRSVAARTGRVDPLRVPRIDPEVPGDWPLRFPE